MMRKVQTTLGTVVATAAAFSMASHAQAAIVTLASQGFEVPTTGWAYAITNTAGATAVASNATGTADTPANARINTGSGSTYSLQDIGGTNTTTFATPIDLTGKTSTHVYIHLAALTTGTLNGLDQPDKVSVSLGLNGQAISATPVLTVTGNSNARWTYTSGTGVAEATSTAIAAGTTTTFVPAGGGDRTADGYSLLQLDIPDGTTSLTMAITENNDSGEIWAIDDISVSAVPEPASLGLLSVGGLALLVRRRRSASR